MPRPRRPLLLLVLLAAALPACERAASPPPASCEEPIAEGFGAPGPYGLSSRRVANPEWPALPVFVFLPDGAPLPVPVLLLAHAYLEAHDVEDAYAGLVAHLGSRGLAVVYPSYPSSGRHEQRYAALWSGFVAGLEAARGLLDLSRMGFIGHSYGAGAVPATAWRALREQGWGSRGAFLYLMAPWFALQIDADALRDFPPHARVLVQVFDDDTANDHRIAIALFEAIGVPGPHKDYLRVQSDRRGACELPALHTVPLSRGAWARDDALDQRAVFRLVDALAAAAFEGDEAGRRVALGQGSAEQLEMGRWPDGTPRRPLLWAAQPEAARPPSAYLFRQDEAEAWRRYAEPARP